jgi:DNA-directed RNA polymerase subunit E'/Rpb7
MYYSETLQQLEILLNGKHDKKKSEEFLKLIYELKGFGFRISTKFLRGFIHNSMKSQNKTIKYFLRNAGLETSRELREFYSWNSNNSILSFKVFLYNQDNKINFKEREIRTGNLTRTPDREILQFIKI